MPSPVPPEQDGERWTIERRDGKWTVLDGPDASTTIAARITVVRAEHPLAARTLQAQLHEAQERADREKSRADDISETCADQSRLYHEELEKRMSAEEQRDKAREQLKVRQEAIDEALSALHSAAYVGGPTEREAWRATLAALEPFETLHQGTDSPPDPERQD